MSESSVPLLNYRIEDILRCCNLKRRSFQNLRLLGKFPAPTQTIGRVPLWHKDVVETWLRGEWRPAGKPARRKSVAAGSK